MTARSPGAAQHPGHRGPAQPIREGQQEFIEARRLGDAIIKNLGLSDYIEQEVQVGLHG
jgi:hypothetical protein